MKLLNHILVVLALLATMLPCGHADVHHDHHHDDGVLSEISAEPCCHSCDHQPCADKVEIQVDRTFHSCTLEQPSFSTVLFVLPEIYLDLKQAPPPVSGILADLRTIQLLI